MNGTPEACTKCGGYIVWDDADIFRCVLCGKRFFFYGQDLTASIIEEGSTTYRTPEQRAAHTHYMRQYMRMYRDRKREETMLTLPYPLRQQLWSLLQAHAPNEACGVLVGTTKELEHVLLFPNYAPDPTQEFWINPLDLADAQAVWPVLVLWHSHPTSRWDLSPADRNVMHRTRLAMVLVAALPFPSITCYAFDPSTDRIALMQRYKRLEQETQPKMAMEG